MKKILLPLLILFLYSASYAQGFPMFLDSARVNVTPQLFFAAHRQTILESGIRSCSIYSFLGQNKADSVLFKTMWFDTAGNMEKCTFGKTREGNYASSFEYDASNRRTQWRVMADKAYNYITKSAYKKDTVETTILQYFHDGDTLYANSKKYVMKAGWDTGYSQAIYNRQNQLTHSVRLFNQGKVITRTKYLYNSKGLPSRRFSTGLNKRKTNQFFYTHEFSNGQYIVTMWDDNASLQKAVMICTYQNGQCIHCREESVGTQFFYTREGLLAEEHYTANSGYQIIYKYHYH